MNMVVSQQVAAVERATYDANGLAKGLRGNVGAELCPHDTRVAVVGVDLPIMPTRVRRVKLERESFLPTHPQITRRLDPRFSCLVLYTYATRFEGKA